MKKIILSVCICTSLFVGALDAASNITEATVHSEKIILGSGCFWGAEKGYESLPGVIDAVSGYADGNGVRASYSEITKLKNKFNVNNHAEVVEVTYNKNLISTEELLIHYFESHDPTQLNRQGNDIGTQYRSIILYSTQEQKQAIDKIMQNYQRLLSAAGYGPIVTAVKPIKNFYKAEKYHQDYIAKNPNGYCPDHSTGVRFIKKKTLETLDNSTLLSGKHIIVIEAEGYCPYCEKFRAQVVENYFGNIPLVFRLASQLQDLVIKSPTWATPTILFIEDGEEVFGHQGYLSPKEFYQALGYFKLGDSEAYRVAFQQGTDARFCKEYEIFKNTPDGIFIDKLSGAPLFDTKDRFNSSTGWLSFTAPIKGAVYTKPDNSYGMRRTEIRSVTSDIHLGHVFPDGPNGMPRYCINATVLEFKPREDFS
ncbi:peptide-methionine (S)-S-oxide reductase MsrA [Gammaproteobacteria bacterium]|nr:peptide-methionine (S)-S-oxide reductase MsrA [Gammaproteobacteria bacterium]MDC0918507.1 peptide-methionine (S)-S-oxide reductase MsrA [Gammaproteobacteria bacterium]